MKTLKIFFFFLSCTLFFACGSSQKVKQPNAVLDEMVANKKFEFRARFAQPMMTNALSQIAVSGLLAPGNTISQIDVSGSANLLRMVEDSIQVNLPYYGERCMGAGYQNDAGIVFNSVLEAIEIEKNEKTQGYLVKFTAQDKTENLQITLSLYPDFSAAVDVYSSYRTRIRYSGKVIPLN